MTEVEASRHPLQLTNAHTALGMLLLVYAFNFIDRIMLGILVPPIKLAMHLTDSELGLLGGTAFALFYTALGIPIGYLADRMNRVWIITLALALWSAFTAACGMASSFVQLFLARLGVGIGEAGGVAPAYSLLSDYFPAPQRARAFAIYSFGIPLGSAAGILFGGLIAARINWRAAFLLIGAAGLLLAPLFRALVHEPPRGRLEAAPPARDAPAIGECLALLIRKRSFWYLGLGAASCSIMGYGVFFWMPSFLVRSYHLSLVQVSWCFSALTLCSGLAGIWLGGYFGDRLGAARRAAYALVPAAAFFLSVPLYAIGMLAPSVPASLPIFLLPMALALAWLGPTMSAVQQLVPADMRALASAIFLFMINLIGLGLGSWLLGRLSDFFATSHGTDSLRYAILSGTGFYIISALLFALAARHLAREWYAEGVS
jgi:MFS family permease